MKGPVECVKPEQVAQGDDFSEFMWMAEENLDDFDKQCEAELMEELRLNQALDDFEDQAEAALYAEQGLNPPRRYAGRRSQEQGANGIVAGMNNLHVSGQRQQNGYGGYQRGPRPSYNNHSQYRGPSPYSAPPPRFPPAAIAATSNLNPNAPAFVFNPNAPAFVPRWSAPAAPPAPPAADAPATNGGQMSYAAAVAHHSAQEDQRSRDDDSTSHHR